MMMSSVELSPMNNENGHDKRRKKKPPSPPQVWIYLIFVRNAVISSNQADLIRSIGEISIRYHIKWLREYGSDKKKTELSLGLSVFGLWKSTSHLNRWVVWWTCESRFCVYVDGVFVIINHWLLHQALKRLNKTKAICFAVIYVCVVQCDVNFFLLPFSLLCNSLVFFLHIQKRTGVQDVSETATTTSSLSSEIYDHCNPNHMCIISSLD